MRLLTRKRQQQIFKRLVDVTTTIAKIEGKEIDYALGDIWEIARFIGGREMLDALVGRNYFSRPLSERMGDRISDSIDAFDNFIDEIHLR